MNKKVFGRTLQKLREEAGYSQEKLAEKINRSSIFISYIERGVKSPSLDTLILLANALDVSVDFLFGNEIKKNNMSKLLYLEKKMDSLPMSSQKRLLDYFEAFITIEYEHLNVDEEIL